MSPALSRPVQYTTEASASINTTLFSWWAPADRSPFRSARGEQVERFDAGCLTADELNSPYDLILLRVKPDTLPAVLDDLAPAVGRRTVAAPLLNGMRHLNLLTERYPEATPLEAW
ncbi:2-dehydropantoate 2-reductase N-terminal domain-containing protein [Streptomyces canus]|uniref:2-dehydropantoate 2-reductase N-terminal domain-containing protein n=1 Tax=Streptomyces canus TaxID=58343 RepID=UPI001319ECB6|nr:2-dehydropantoate 2-reductase N-terminal domain-containing protein [Streptomyces canus]